MMKTKFGLLCVELTLADMFTLADASVDKPIRATCLTETMIADLLLRCGDSKGTMTRSRNKRNKRLSSHIYMYFRRNHHSGVCRDFAGGIIPTNSLESMPFS